MMDSKEKVSAVSLTLSERYCRWMFFNTSAYCCILTLVVLVMTLATFRLNFFVIVDTTLFDLSVTESEGSINYDAYLDAQDKTDLSTLEDSAVVPPRTRTTDFNAFRLIFEWSDPQETSHFFTASNIQLVCEVEAIVRSTTDFTKFCVTANAQGDSTTCLKGTFALSDYFYDGADAITCPLLNSTEFTTRYQNLLLSPSGLFFLSIDYSVSNPISIATRSQIDIGGPLGADTTDDETFTNPIEFGDVEDPQYPFYEEWFQTLQDNLFETFGIGERRFRSGYEIGAVLYGPNDEIKVRWESQTLRIAETQKLLQSDQTLAIAAGLFVTFAMYAHLRSVFIALTGIALIAASVPVGLFIYRVFGRIEYFTDLHVVVIFLILGIGADVVFVVTDGWKQSLYLFGAVRGISTEEEAKERNFYGTGDMEKEVLIARFVYTTRRGVAQIANTSATTIFAFVGTTTSPVNPISAFGIYAALCVFVLFLWTLSFMPMIVLIHHRNFAGRPFCCPCILHQDVQPKFVELDPNRPAQDQQNDHELTLTWEDKVFTNLYIPMMRLEVGGIKPVPIVCTLGLLGLFAAMLSFALKLTPPTEVEGNFADSHMFATFRNDYQANFQGGDDADFMEVNLVWGISGIDRTGFNRYNPTENRGDAIFDLTFNLAPRASQEYVIATCEYLRNITCTLEACTGQQYLVFPNKVTCPLEAFHSYHLLTYNTSALDVGENTPQLFNARLLNFTRDNFLNDAFGFINGTVRYHSIEFLATLRALQPVAVKEPIFELFDEVLDEIVALAPNELKTAFMTSFDMLWIFTEKGIIEGLYSGLTIALIAAIIILLFGTGNVYLTTFAVISIVSVVSFTLGIAYLLGWSLGIPEAVASTTVLGLSVDYTIHSGGLYSMAREEGHQTRQARFEFSARNMGPTIIAAAITTGGAGALLLATQLIIFFKMGVLIVSAIAMSLVYSLFFFLPACLLVGPEYNQGDWMRLFCKPSDAEMSVAKEDI